MVTPSGDVRVFDFGLARDHDGESFTMSGDFVRTPNYASPEQVAGDSGHLDARSDVYSIGATLYELLTLRPPFSGEDTRAVLRAIETRDRVGRGRRRLLEREHSELAN